MHEANCARRAGRWLPLKIFSLGVPDSRGAAWALHVQAAVDRVDLPGDVAPVPPPRRRSSLARCSTIRAPEAPIGWPIAIAPPLTLTMSLLISRSRMDWMATDANASFISKSSTRSMARPSRDNVYRAAVDGRRVLLSQPRATPGLAPPGPAGPRIRRSAADAAGAPGRRRSRPALPPGPRTRWWR